ncbi:MAG: chitobiase/beta-hexosaminidase C-terminal domain-containing protein [Opitutales bacterium]|nr:chitobiase/beta-hexosaminidase C-terminal domain-containing protein [Opitutales bacterium]
MLALCGQAAEEYSVVINEVMASNGSTIADEDGDYEDWIELYNYGESAVDLSGWGLSDSYSNPFKWTLPVGTFIEAGAYRLVWASGKDRKATEELAEPGILREVYFNIPGSSVSQLVDHSRFPAHPDIREDDNLAVGWERPDTGAVERPMPLDSIRPIPPGLHTNFAISAAGEEIILTLPDGTRIDELPPTPIPRDVSYGRVGDGPGEWAYFADPTPGAANDTTPLAMPPPVAMSEPAGFHETPFELTLGTDDPSAVIHYTLDGSTPGPASPLYSGPLTISQTTTLRAAVVGEGLLSVPPQTRTWIFPDDVIAQDAQAPPGWPGNREINNKRIEYGMLRSIVTNDSVRLREGLLSIPSVSIVTDLPNLFDPDTGIYVNARQVGWERPVSVELLDPETGPEGGFQVEAGLRIRGAYSRNDDNPKHSLRLLFRTAYGDSQLHFPLFGEEGADTFDRVDLRTANNYSWAWENSNRNTFLRDVFSRDTQLDMGAPSTRSRFYHLYLNGQYWGLYQTQERGDRFFASTYLGGGSEDWARVKTGQPDYHMDVDPEAEDPWTTLHHIAINEGFTGAFTDNYYRVQGLNPDGSRNPDLPVLVDEDNLIILTLIAHYTADPDSPASFAFVGRPNNLYALINYKEPNGFKWLRHDTEHSLGAQNAYGPGYNMTNVVVSWTELHRFNPLTLHSRLIQHPEYRMRFADLAHKYLFGDGALTPEKSLARLQRRIDEIDLAVIAESARWGSGRTREGDWLPAVGQVISFLEQRRDYFVSHLRGAGWLPGIEPPQLEIDGRTLRMTAAVPVYYTTDGNDPRLPGGGIHPDAVLISPAPGEADIALNRSDRIFARAFDGADWSPAATLVAEDMLDPGVVVHAWDFEAEAGFPGPSRTTGGGALSVESGPDTELERNPAAQGFSTAHLRVNNPLGAVVTFELPTTGFEAVTLDFLTRRSGQGAGSQTIAYTTDGAEWHDFATYNVFNESPMEQRFDFGGVAASADNPDFAVRISFSGGDGGEAGNNRFDDVVLRGVPLQGTNLPPTVVEEAVPAALSGTAGAGAFAVNVSDWFSDPDGDDLTFTTVSTVPGVLTASADGASVWLSPVETGGAVVTVAAADGHNPPVETSVYVLVYPGPHALAEGMFAFGEWSAAEPAGSFPPHMIFVQSEVTDPDVNTELPFAYHIPPGDAAVPIDAGFPYAAESRSRINGLGEVGISFINTGRGRDIGAALVALDTRGVTNVAVSFTAQTVLPNTRVYGLRLQARVGDAGPWEDVLIDGSPVEYIRSDTAGDLAEMGPVRLPDALEDRPLVQLQWRYHHLDVTSGPRAKIRLDDIAVTSVTPGPGFSEWVEENFPEPGDRTEPDVSGPFADPAGKGLSNLMRYAFGLRIADPVPSEPTSIALREGPVLSITFPRDPAKTDIVYIVEASEDLLEWPEILYDSSADSRENNLGDRMRIEDSRLLTGEENRFLRLRVDGTGLLD